MESLGIDVHSKYSKVCGLSDDGTVTVRRRVATTETALRRFFGAWRSTLEVAPQSSFADNIDFFVNLPSLADKPADRATVRAWKRPWLEASTLQDTFSTSPVVVRLIRELGTTDSLLESGWWLKDDSGRIDTETTPVGLFVSAEYGASLRLESAVPGDRSLSGLSPVRNCSAASLPRLLLSPPFLCRQTRQRVGWKAPIQWRNNQHGSQSIQ